MAADRASGGCGARVRGAAFLDGRRRRCGRDAGGRGGWRDAWRMSADARGSRPAPIDAALLLPNSFHAAWLARRAGIAAALGLSRPTCRSRCSRAPCRGRDAFMHQAEYYLQLVPRAWRIPGTDGCGLRVTPDEDRRQAVSLLEARAGTARACRLCAGSGVRPGEAWPPDRMAATAAALAQRMQDHADAGRPAADRRHARGRERPTGARSARRRRSSMSLAARTCARSWLSSPCARRVVSNDSGAMHVAAASGVPVDRDLRSDQRAAHRAAAASIRGAAPPSWRVDAWCRPCELRACPIDHRCMTSIDVETVVAPPSATSACGGGARRAA